MKRYKRSKKGLSKEQVKEVKKEIRDIYKHAGRKFIPPSVARAIALKRVLG